jgi:hypothetical protein
MKTKTQIARAEYRPWPGWPASPTDAVALLQRQSDIRDLQAKYEAALREKTPAAE